MIRILILSVSLYFISVVYACAAPTGYVMQVDLSPALCQIDNSVKRSRQCLDGYAFVISDFAPDNLGAADHRTCETSSSAFLTPIQKRILMRIIPDENVQARLWRTVGGCMSTSASQYFRMMVSLADRLNIPSELHNPTTIRVSKQGLLQRFVSLNKGLPASGVQISCRSDGRHNVVLTRIQVCYQTNGQYKSCRPEYVNNSCPSQFNVQGSY